MRTNADDKSYTRSYQMTVPDTSKSTKSNLQQRLQYQQHLHHHHRHVNDEEHRLGVWLNQQLRDYKHKTGDLADPEHHAKFTELLKEYKHLWTDDDLELLGMSMDEINKL